MGHQTDEIYIGIRLFLKRLMKLGVFYPYMVEKFRTRIVIKNISVYDVMHDLYMFLITYARKDDVNRMEHDRYFAYWYLCSHFNCSSVSFFWSASVRQFEYWSFVYRKIVRSTNTYRTNGYSCTL